MAWLQSLDAAMFRFINGTLSHPALDVVMPLFVGGPWFVGVVLACTVVALWKGGARVRTFVIVLAAVLALGEGLVINSLKKACGRARPYEALTDVNLRVGRGSRESMPSSHTATAFAVATVACVYFRRSWRWLLPLAFGQGFSRVYLGAHFPSDVLVGGLLGIVYAAAGVFGLSWLWGAAGRAWFSEWHARFPSLLQPEKVQSLPNAGAKSPSTEAARAAALNSPQWLRLGYALIALCFVGRLAYLASGRIDLSEDEAYQWLWSKHLALSYYSKPPMIALAQWVGTHLWGDTVFGVRFLSPVCAALVSWMLLRFLGREVSPAAGFWTIAVCQSAPLPAVGATLLTVDPLLVLFCTAAMVTGWRAVQSDGTTGHWLWTGLWLGLGFLSKYTAALQLVSFALFFALRREARCHLRRPGPWAAFGVFALCTLPVIIWNAQHQWITVRHVGENAKLDQPWQPTLRYFFEFVGAEAALLNPIFFVAALWAMIALWRRSRTGFQPVAGASSPSQQHGQDALGDRLEAHPTRVLWVYLFCHAAPVFLGYWLYSFHSRIFPNWIAAAVVPMFCLAVVVGESRWRAGSRAPVRWLTAGLIFGGVMVALLHETNLVAKLTGRRLPPRVDPLRRVRGWKETAAVVGQASRQLLAEGREVIVIGSHYGLTGQLSFYLPEARVGLPDRPLVYYQSSDRPKNQFFFWPGYRERHTGANAIYVDEADDPVLRPGWIAPWLRGSTNLYEATDPPLQPIPAEVAREFESVTDLGVRAVEFRGQVVRRIHLFACRNLRPHATQ